VLARKSTQVPKGPPSAQEARPAGQASPRLSHLCTKRLDRPHLLEHRLQLHSPDALLKPPLHPVENPHHPRRSAPAHRQQHQPKRPRIRRATSPLASSDEIEWLIFPRVVSNVSASRDGLISPFFSRKIAASNIASMAVNSSCSRMLFNDAFIFRATRPIWNAGLCRRNDSIRIPLSYCLIHSTI